MALGKLKWFDETVGYGFISPNDGGKDLFARFFRDSSWRL